MEEKGKDRWHQGQSPWRWAGRPAGERGWRQHSATAITEVMGITKRANNCCCCCYCKAFLAPQARATSGSSSTVKFPRAVYSAEHRFPLPSPALQTGPVHFCSPFYPFSSFPSAESRAHCTRGGDVAVLCDSYCYRYILPPPFSFGGFPAPSAPHVHGLYVLVNLSFSLCCSVSCRRLLCQPALERGTVLEHLAVARELQRSPSIQY